jgi:hypothetical protein
MSAGMKEVEQQSGGKYSYNSPVEWKGAPAIQLVHQMNERCIDLLCELSIDHDPECDWPFLRSNRDLWSRLDAQSRKRLATFPYVLVDIRFGDGLWWQAIRSRSSTDWGKEVRGQGLPKPDFECLALEALMFAWQVVRENKRVAHVIFAMAPSVALSISALSMQQIRTVANQSAKELRFHWNDKPELWRELLIAARTADETALLALKHHAGRRVLDVLRNVSQS